MLASFLCLAALLLAVIVGPSAAANDGQEAAVAFTEPAPLASRAELTRRLLTPFAAALDQQERARGGANATPDLALADAGFTLYVPPTAPPDGYGLLVFIPPGPRADMPPGWAPVFDQFGVIFVSAARSGNDQPILARRAPLALIAAQNVQMHYKIDPERVLVGGFSGGARVAERLALGFPDLFRGALLNAGSDAIGTADLPLPPSDLFATFQARSRLVFVTGDDDLVNLGLDQRSRLSLDHWCVFAFADQPIPWKGHALAGPKELARALAWLLTPVIPDQPRLDSCRAGIAREIDRQFETVLGLLADGQTDAARRALRAIDLSYGGLALPRSLALLPK